MASAVCLPFGVAIAATVGPGRASPELVRVGVVLGADNRTAGPFGRALTSDQEQWAADAAEVTCSPFFFRLFGTPPLGAVTREGRAPHRIPAH